MATATTVTNLTTEELARKIEECLERGCQEASNGGARMIYEDLLLIGSCEKSFLSIVKTELKKLRISCTDEEIGSAGLVIREKSLKARGLR